MARKKYYECKITLGKAITGEIIRKSFYSSKSKSDAKRKAEKYRAAHELELLCGGNEPVRHTLFSAWALECLELYKKPYVKPNTYSGTYLSPVQNHLIPHFGNMALDAILPIHVQQYINEAAKQYSPETVKKDYAAMSFIMQTAVDNGLCRTSPVTKTIRLPKYKTVTEKTAFTQQEYDTAFAFAVQHPLGLDIMFLMETGISRSELLGLRWEDLDLEQGTVTISQGLVSYYDDEAGQWTISADGLKISIGNAPSPLSINSCWSGSGKSRTRLSLPERKKR